MVLVPHGPARGQSVTRQGITERQRYRNWLDAQIADHGLIDVAICSDPMDDLICTDALRFNPDLSEEFFRELNAVNAAIARGEARLMGPADFGEPDIRVL